MAKYYVESGEFRALVQADDARTAAVWAIHLAMEDEMPLDELNLSDDQQEDMRFVDSVCKLGLHIFISEVGFERAESGLFNTLDILTEWNQLAVAVTRMSEGLAE